MVTLNEALLLLTAMGCSAISITLGTHQRKGAKHSLITKILTLILIVASGSVVILILAGYYKTVNPPEAILIVAFAVVVVLAGGDISKIFRYHNPHKTE